MTEKKLTPFDFINSVSHSKVDMLKDEPDNEKEYVPYVINRGLSYFIDTILHANEMNRLHNLPKSAQYYYYYSVLRRKKRFSKWHKLEKNEDLDLIQEVYNVRRDVAKQYLKLISPEDLERIRDSRNTGGMTK